MIKLTQAEYDLIMEEISVIPEPLDEDGQPVRSLPGSVEELEKVLPESEKERFTYASWLIDKAMDHVLTPEDMKVLDRLEDVVNSTVKISG